MDFNPQNKQSKNTQYTKKVKYFTLHNMFLSHMQNHDLHWHFYVK